MIDDVELEKPGKLGGKMGRVTGKRAEIRSLGNVEYHLDDRRVKQFHWNGHAIGEKGDPEGNRMMLVTDNNERIEVRKRTTVNWAKVAEAIVDGIRRGNLSQSKMFEKADEEVFREWMKEDGDGREMIFFLLAQICHVYGDLTASCGKGNARNNNEIADSIIGYSNEVRQCVNLYYDLSMIATNDWEETKDLVSKKAKHMMGFFQGQLECVIGKPFTKLFIKLVERQMFRNLRILETGR